ncbi:penicillin acylase family protein, partial [Candidatus Megaera venefica]|uniref:penicillin acylase family protein n=1 Tax=Candidatus Megaera venefica TaxID=2055910 RepID=UPI002AD35C89
DKSISTFLPLPTSEAFKYLAQNQKNEVVYSSSLKQEKFGIGSNQWALEGKFTKDGRSILACDLHLDLMVPNIWYHAGLKYNKNGEEIFVVGATLPGTPLIIVGSNGHVSWGLTNAELDTSDLVLLESDEKIWQREEIIKVKGDKDFLTEIDQSQWGPVIPGTYLNHRFALKWVAHDTQACNLGFIDLESEKDVYSAISTSRHIKGPILNFMFADKSGKVGWTLVGTLPKRIGFNGELPIQSNSIEAKTLGIQNTKLYPAVYNTKEGFLFTANNRTLDTSWESIIGHGTYINPIRAYQIQKSLGTLQTSELEMLRLQFSDEAIFFNRWHTLMLSLIEDKNSSLYNLIQSWDKHASSESRAYPLIREFRQTVLETFLIKILQPVLDQYSDFPLSMFDFEEPIWMIVNSNICDVLSKDMGSCRSKLSDILYKINIKYELAGYPTWGEINQTVIQHPLSSISILLEKFLDMPKNPSSGDFFVPKVLVKNVGASLRMVVKPGAENEGIYQSPTGQASNPISQFYRVGYKEWASGQSFPLTVIVKDSIGQIRLVPGK